MGFDETGLSLLEMTGGGSRLYEYGTNMPHQRSVQWRDVVNQRERSVRISSALISLRTFMAQARHYYSETEQRQQNTASSEDPELNSEVIEE